MESPTKVNLHHDGARALLIEVFFRSKTNLTKSQTSFPLTRGVKFRLRPTCDDCGVDTIDIGEWYMVQDSVWQQVVGYVGRASIYPWDQTYFCVGCLERRLGRRLTSADFTDAPINNPAEGGYYSDRLLDRLR